MSRAWRKGISVCPRHPSLVTPALGEMPPHLGMQVPRDPAPPSPACLHTHTHSLTAAFTSPQTHLSHPAQDGGVGRGSPSPLGRSSLSSHSQVLHPAALFESLSRSHQCHCIVRSLPAGLLAGRFLSGIQGHPQWVAGAILSLPADSTNRSCFFCCSDWRVFS